MLPYRLAGTEVMETLQQVELILIGMQTTVEINLRRTIHILMVDVEVMLLICHDLREVVVVGYTDRHRIRIGLTEVCHRVEGNLVILILIPIELRLVVDKRHAIATGLIIVLTWEQFPTVCDNLVKTRVHRRRLHAEGVTRQDGRRCAQLTDLRCSTLQLQVNVHHVEFVGQRYTVTLIVILIISILIDHADDLLLSHILED